MNSKHVIPAQAGIQDTIEKALGARGSLPSTSIVGGHDTDHRKLRTNPR